MVKILRLIRPYFEKFPYWQKKFIYSTAIWKQWIYYRFQEKHSTIQFIFCKLVLLNNNNSQLQPTLSYKTNERLSLIKIMDNHILKIIAKLNLNKAHGQYLHDKDI